MWIKNSRWRWMMVGLLSFSVAQSSDLSPEPSVQKSGEPSNRKPFTAYHIGNSLTRSLSLFRLESLFNAQGTEYYFGSRMGAGVALGEFYAGQYYGNEIKNTGYEHRPVAPYRISDDMTTTRYYGDNWKDAFRQHTFDAVILQHYQDYLQYEPSLMDHPGKRVSHFGAVPAFKGFLDFITGNSAENQHLSSKNIFLYATWPQVPRMVKRYSVSNSVIQNPGPADYAAYSGHWEQVSVQPSVTRSSSDVGPSRTFYDQFLFLINRHRAEKYPQIPPIKMIPVGHVYYELDKMIKSERLPGIREYFKRNWKYYRQARVNSEKCYEFPFDIDEEHPYRPEWGVLNLYCDNIHMNDQPHDKTKEGTLGPYVASLTMFSVLSKTPALGAPCAAWESFDAEKDATLIRALQETVDRVIAQVHARQDLPHYPVTIRHNDAGYAAGSGWYPEGCAVPLTAIPKGEFSFDHWKGPVENPRAVTTKVVMGKEPIEIEVVYSTKMREVILGVNEDHMEWDLQPAVWSERSIATQVKDKTVPRKILVSQVRIGANVELPKLRFVNNYAPAQDDDFPYKTVQPQDFIEIKEAHNNAPFKVYIDSAIISPKHPRWATLKDELVEIQLDLGEPGKYASFSAKAEKNSLKKILVRKGNSIGVPEIFLLQKSHRLAGWDGELKNIREGAKFQALWKPVSE